MKNVIRAVILAAGKGARMRSDSTKVLHDILGLPMIAYPIVAARDAGVSSITVVVGYQEEAVKEATEKSGVSFIRQKSLGGTGDALLACSALREFNGTILVLPGDAPLTTTATIVRMADRHRESAADCTLLSGAGDSLIALVQSPLIFEVLDEIKRNRTKGDCDLRDAVNLMLSRGNRVELVEPLIPEEAMGVKTRKDLATAVDLLRKTILDDKMALGVTIVDPSTTYIEQNVKIGADTVIQPFTTIRSGVVIGKHCEVGPFTQLRKGAFLEDHAEVGNFVEVKNSRIGSHSKAKHLSYLGDATLGKHVNIGAGTITANYDGKRKHPTTIKNGAMTGSNTVLVAPVTMGKNSKTGAGAVVPSGRNIRDGDIVVGVPAVSIKLRRKS